MTRFLDKLLILITHEENSKLTRLEERILYFLLKRDSYGNEIREAICKVTEGEIYLVDGTFIYGFKAIRENGIVRILLGRKKFRKKKR